MKKANNASSETARRAILILATAALASIAPALGARAQGSVELDNSQSRGRVCFFAPGNDYSGIYGLEVWMLNSNVVPPELRNGNLASYNPFTAYVTMANYGFVRVATFADQDMSATPGVFRLGELDMPGVILKGAAVVLGLAVWTGAGSSWATSGPTGFWGVLAFANPTADYTAVPAPVPPPLSGMTSDLVLTTIPEPSALALAAVGAAAWLFARRHQG